jgi:hypothetical protein
MNEEAFERAEGIVEFSSILLLREAIEYIAGDMLEDGFDIDDVKEFLNVEIKNALYDFE